jgi:hypothetical protein
MKLVRLLGCLVFLLGTMGNKDNLIHQMSISAKHPSRNDFGVATNCGKSAVSAMWTPKDLSPVGELTAYFNITLPFDLNGGYAEVDVYNHKDGSVVAQFGTPFTCSDIVKWIACPQSKGQFIKMEQTFPDLTALSQYPGTFDIVFQVNNLQDQEILCLNATVTVVR